MLRRITEIINICKFDRAAKRRGFFIMSVISNLDKLEFNGVIMCKLFLSATTRKVTKETPHGEGKVS